MVGGGRNLCALSQSSVIGLLAAPCKTPATAWGRAGVLHGCGVAWGANPAGAVRGTGRLAGDQFDCLISRPDADWMGLAFIGYRRENTLTWSTAIGTGCCITIHNTPSLQGGVVSEPM